MHPHASGIAITDSNRPLIGTAGGSSGWLVEDMDRSVRSAMQRGALLWVLPWMSAMLWFVPPEASHQLLRPETLAHLSAARWVLIPILRVDAGMHGPTAGVSNWMS